MCPHTARPVWRSPRRSCGNTGGRASRVCTHRTRRGWERASDSPPTPAPLPGQVPSESQGEAMADQPQAEGGVARGCPRTGQMEK